MVAHHQRIDVGKHETAVRIFRSAHNRFSADIKTRVDNNWASRRPIKPVQHYNKTDRGVQDLRFEFGR
jgi:hypothetical protein